MTLDEAENVARLIGHADHACSNCVRDLVTHANRIFPGFRFSCVGDYLLERIPAGDYGEGEVIACVSAYLSVDVRAV